MVSRIKKRSTYFVLVWSGAKKKGEKKEERDTIRPRIPIKSQCFAESSLRDSIDDNVQLFAMASSTDTHLLTYSSRLVVHLFFNTERAKKNKGIEIFPITCTRFSRVFFHHTPFTHFTAIRFYMYTYSRYNCCPPRCKRTKKLRNYIFLFTQRNTYLFIGWKLKKKNVGFVFSSLERRTRIPE